MVVFKQCFTTRDSRYKYIGDADLVMEMEDVVKVSLLALEHLLDAARAAVGGVIAVAGKLGVTLLTVLLYT